MDGEQMKKYFEQYGDEIMEMLKKREIAGKSSSNEEIGNYFKEHSNEITEMMIRKSFKDGINNEEKTSAYIQKMQQKGQAIKQKAEDFGVKTYEYESNFDELVQTQTSLTNECNKNFGENDLKKMIKNEQNLDNLNIAAHQFYQDSVDSCKDYNKMYEQYTHKQDDALLQALNVQALLTLHTTDYKNLKMEADKIQNRKSIDKIKDLLSGQSKVKKERSIEINKALKIIKDRIEIDKKEHEDPSLPNAKTKPEQVMANLYKARKAIEISRGSDFEHTDRFSQMIDYVKENYNVNFRQVNELIYVGENQLPQVIGKDVKISEQQKMKYFMEHQGYIDKDGIAIVDKNKKSSTLQPIDTIKTWAIEKIETIKNRVSKVKEVGDMLRNGKDINKETPNKENQLKGMGKGFNIVR